jgi:hypothetical protein
LSEQLDRTGILASSQRSCSTNGKHGDSAKELNKLSRCSRIEAAVGAAGQASDLAKDLFNFAIVTLLKHENPHTEASELASIPAEGIGIFLHCVADEGERLHRKDFGFALGVRQHLADLRLPHPAGDALHQPGKLLALGKPA